MLSPREIIRLKRQRFLSALFFYPLYALLRILGRFYLHYRFKNIDAFQKEIWKKLDAHQGPVIWAANHLTLIDSFIIFCAVFPWRKINRYRLVPWSTPEYRNYYHLGGPIKKWFIRSIMYLCRCIPFLREGEDEASERWRQKVFEKCAWILKNNGSVFIYPEAARSRSGWLERHRPKDFLGRLALEVPQAQFLCVYLRGEDQVCTTAIPRKGETFRMYGDLIPGVTPELSTPRAITQHLFERLAELQEQWFAQSAMPKNCSGNDIIDLKSPLIQENCDPQTGEADPQWLSRHLTPKEIAYLSHLEKGPGLYAAIWKFIAAKEAAHKAFAQSGIETPLGGFLMIGVDLFRRKARHLVTGAQTDIAFTHDDGDKVHCIAVLRGGYIGEDLTQSDVLWGVDEVPPGTSPHEFVRDQCLKLIAESSDEISCPSALSFTEDDGVPKVLYHGKIKDWGVSLSHSGRFVAYSFMIS